MPYDGIERVFISKGDYSLRRSGEKNAARHDEKVKEAIRGDLDSILADDAIITADPNSKKIIKVPLRALELPHIVHKNGNNGVGSGEGNEGEVIGVEPGQGGKGAGQGAGHETYETEVSLEEIQKLVFAELGLPFLRPKKQQQLETETVVFDDIRPKRSPSNLDIYRTMEQNMRRNAEERGKAEFSGLIPEDYRVRTWRPEVKEENAAAVIFMRDFSGSMGPVETYLTRAFGWWAVSFLRSKYPRVETAFIVHDTNAYVVNEEGFFRRNDGGGTTCSTAYAKGLELVKTTYSPDRFNVYMLHFSDGDNWNDDDAKCVGLVKEMLDLDIAQAGFVQVGSNRDSSLRTALTKGVQHPRFVTILVLSKNDVKPGLKTFFDPSKVAAA